MDIEFKLDEPLKPDGNKRFKLTNGNYFFTNCMPFTNLEIVHCDNNNSRIFSIKKSSIKELYTSFFKEINDCKHKINNRNIYSEIINNVTNKNFSIDDKTELAAEKYRFYSESEVHSLEQTKEGKTKIKSCRLNRAENQTITINELKYYPANNLHVSEFIYALVNYIPEKYRGNFTLKVYGLEIGESLVNKEEISDVSIESSKKEWTITIDKGINESSKKKQNGNKNSPEIITTTKDYIDRDIKKIKLGALGEKIVEQYLKNENKKDVKIVSADSSLGYDITYKDSDGTEKYIEVKTTRNKQDDGFYISLNEKTKFATLENYEIYRVFNLDEKEKKASIKIYTKSDINNLDFQPMQFYVKKK